MSPRKRDKGHVWGEVALSGVVIEGEHGFRAERATIQRLTIKHVAQEWETHTRTGDRLPGHPTEPQTDGMGWSSHVITWGGGPPKLDRPQDVSLFQIANDLAERYQVDVEIA